jgi:hypothetical protein
MAGGFIEPEDRLIASAEQRSGAGLDFALEPSRSRAAFMIVRPWRSFIHGRIDQMRGVMDEDAEGGLRIDIRADTAAIEMNAAGCRLDADLWPSIRLELSTEPRSRRSPIVGAHGRISLNGTELDLDARVHHLGEGPAGNGYPVRRLIGITGSIPRDAWPVRLAAGVSWLARAQMRSLDIDLYLEWSRPNEN